MPCKIHIHDTVSGGVVIYDEDRDWPGADFHWTEGNYACDCNRGIFFLGPENADHVCGESRYWIEVFSLTGDLLYSEAPE